MEDLIKKGGADRVSEDAKKELKNYLETEAARIGAEAAKFARHAGRKTVNASDIRLAVTSR